MRLRFVLLVLICLTVIPGYGQSESVVQGVVFRKSTNVRLAAVMVTNKRTGNLVKTNNLGLFSLLAQPGDTLVFNVLGYLKKELVLTNLEDQVVYLQQSSQIAEVTVRGTSLQQELKEVEESFRSKGIYYKGKPPLRLLLPIGGSPLTYLHERLSKDGKRARRWHRYADRELENYKIAQRFNDNAIRKAVPIKDEELLEFKEMFWPKLSDLNTWNDFDLYRYIKESYEKFKARE